MTYTPKNLRRLPEDFGKIGYSIRELRSSPIILLSADGTIEYARTIEDKVPLLGRYHEQDGDVLLWAWQGQYRTEIFLLTQADLDKFWNPPKT